MRGHTPIVELPGNRQSISAASAVNAKGAFWFVTYKGGMTAELFVALLKCAGADPEIVHLDGRTARTYEHATICYRPHAWAQT